MHSRPKINLFRPGAPLSHIRSLPRDALPLGSLPLLTPLFQASLAETKTLATSLQNSLSEALKNEQVLLNQVKVKSKEIAELEASSRSAREAPNQLQADKRLPTGESPGDRGNNTWDKRAEVNSREDACDTAIVTATSPNRIKPATPLRKHLSAAQSDAQVPSC